MSRATWRPKFQFESKTSARRELELEMSPGDSLKGGQSSYHSSIEQDIRMLSWLEIPCIAISSIYHLVLALAPQAGHW